MIVKIMPDGPEADLGAIKKAAEGKLKEDGAQNITFEEKDIAFGLKAVMVKFAWPEEKDTSIFEDKLVGIEHVSSADTDDYRRAFG